MQRQHWFTLSLIALATLAVTRNASAQDVLTDPRFEQPYSLRLSVDEVSLSFHAADAHGLAVNDLKLGELKLFDNGRPPRRILSFQTYQDLPLHAAILLDTSESMNGSLQHCRAIALLLAQRLLRQPADKALILNFGFISRVMQPWTSDSAALSAGIRQATAGKENPLGGTALFDAIFRSCLYDFGKIDHQTGGNFILLLSDGADNISHTSLREVVDMCQRNNTAIYAFRSEPHPDLYSSGPKTLAELASQTGGRVFAEDDTGAGIDTALGVIESDLRSQYLVVYDPPELKHDGSFHRIELRVPERVNSMNVRTGYYAPVQ